MKNAFIFLYWEPDSASIEWRELRKHSLVTLPHHNGGKGANHSSILQGDIVAVSWNFITESECRHRAASIPASCPREATASGILFPQEVGICHFGGEGEEMCALGSGFS